MQNRSPEAIINTFSSWLHVGLRNNRVFCAHSLRQSPIENTLVVAVQSGAAYTLSFNPAYDYLPELGSHLPQQPIRFQPIRCIH
jgi:hypothetical protein